MKTLLFFLLICSGLLALVAGFTKDDHEIFRLRDEIEAAEGSDVTFYGKIYTRLHRFIADCHVTSRFSRCEGQCFSGGSR